MLSGLKQVLESRQGQVLIKNLFFKRNINGFLSIQLSYNMPQAKNKKSAAKGSKKASEAAKVEQEQEPQAQVVVQDEEEEPSEVRPFHLGTKLLTLEPKVILLLFIFEGAVGFNFLALNT